MDSNALKAKIILFGKTIDDIVNELEEKKGVKLSRETFYRKLRGTSDFSRKEILALSELLDMSDSETMDIFFNDKVS
jgi:hypothetical protein